MRFLNTSDVRKKLKASGKRMSKHFLLALSVHVEHCVSEAAKAAGPAITVKDDDLYAFLLRTERNLHGGRRGI